MIVELKSLMPVLEETLEEIMLHTRNDAGDPPPRAPEGEFRESIPIPRLEIETAAPETILPAGENQLSILLEQLVQSSERNAVSSEKIAELLENRETNSGLTYN